jgi:hypothetical protein
MNDSLPPSSDSHLPPEHKSEKSSNFSFWIGAAAILVILFYLGYRNGAESLFF